MEASKLGFNKIYGPKNISKVKIPENVQYIGISNISNVVSNDTF